MVEVLESEYDKPETIDKLWEDLFIDHIKEFDMVIRPYDDGIINEFDSLDELRVFDPAFIENVDSDIFDNIVQILGCSKSEIHDVYPLKQGLTNLSCHFATDSGEYVYRHPGVGTELLIDREGEVAAQKVARELGLDGTYIFEDPKRGWKISKFIPNCRNIDPHDAGQVAKDVYKRQVSSDSVIDLPALYTKERPWAWSLFHFCLEWLVSYGDPVVGYH